VALDDHRILAVGRITDDGEITLNYVSPGAWFRGQHDTPRRTQEARSRTR
jgi:hypothetical protein